MLDFEGPRTALGDEVFEVGCKPALPLHPMGEAGQDMPNLPVVLLVQPQVLMTVHQT